MPGFRTSLFVQSYLTEQTPTAELVRHTGVGTVVTLNHIRRRNPARDLLAAASTIRELSPTADILLDRNRYNAKPRGRACDGLDRRWTDDQQNLLKLPWALTDSGFCDDLADVGQVLNDAGRLPGQVVAALPIPWQLLRDHAGDIAKRISDIGVPAAVMLQHEKDPFDEPGVAEGLVHLIRASEQRILLLRSDTSSLGAISHGAAVGAVGTSSGLRHIYPPREGQGGKKQPTCFVIPELLGYYRQHRFAQAYLQDPTLTAWRCPCWFCDGRDLTWIGNTPENTQDVFAFQHSVAALARLGHVMARYAAATHPVQAWDTICGLAQIAHDAVSNPSGSQWQPKKALRHWREASTALAP